ncbi:MAG: hypothetical protein LBT23_06625 [Synergistaceae bacterium]|jgi:Zn-dependent metalloprotease|nr:hypothetical protein [Synergistaceae bacterium]
MKKISLLLIGLLFMMFLCILGSTSIDAAEEFDDVNALSLSDKNEDFSLDELRKLNGDKFDILFNRKTNIPSFIDGKFSTKKILTGEDAILSLLSVKSLMNMNNPIDEFICFKIEKDGNLNCFRMQQVYNGIEVFGKQLVIISNEDGEACSLSGDYSPGISLDLKTTLKSIFQQQNELIGEVTRANKFTIIGAPELSIFVSEDFAPYLCWKFNVSGRTEADNALILADTKTGAIVAQFRTTYTMTDY